MDGWQFEYETARVLRANGYENVQVTSGSGDFGVDVLAEKNGVKYAIQCKYYSEQAGVSAIQQAYTGKSFYDCDKAIVLATHGFTNAAKELAMKLNVELWDSNNLSQMTANEVEDYNAPDFESICFLESIKSAAFDVPIGTKDTGEVIICNILKSGNIIVGGDSLSPVDNYMHILLLPLLYKNDPNDLRVILIDTRMLEYGQYNGQSNLLIPTITDPTKAIGALQWAVLEIKKRYQLFANERCRNIEAYNEQAARTETATLPRMLVYINDLSDIADRDEAIDIIQQIQIRGNAVGIYLVAFIRNPLLSNSLKKLFSSFQTRICLKMSSPEFSKAILDSREAAYIQENELVFYSGFYSGEHRLKTISFDIDDVLYYRVLIKNKWKQDKEYDNHINQDIEGNIQSKGKNTETDENYDEMLDDAVNVVIENGVASVSMLQRRLNLGYSRAARIVDQMEELGIVGPFEGSKPRPLLISREEWKVRKGSGGMNERAKYCPQCGKQNPAKAQFCAFCGSHF